MRLTPSGRNERVTPVAWFDSDRPLRSGWAWGQEFLQGSWLGWHLKDWKRESLSSLGGPWNKSCTSSNKSNLQTEARVLYTFYLPNLDSHFLGNKGSVRNYRAVETKTKGLTCDFIQYIKNISLTDLRSGSHDPVPHVSHDGDFLHWEIRLIFFSQSETQGCNRSLT